MYHAIRSLALVFCLCVTAQAGGYYGTITTGQPFMAT